MKKQSKKSKIKEAKTKDTPKRKYQKAKEQPEKEEKKPTKQQEKKEQPQDNTTEEEQHNHEVTQSQTNESVEEAKNQADEKPEPFIEPQSKAPDNPIVQLNQSQIQVLRSRFSGLTPDHFEGETAEQVLQHLAEITNTDINELKTVVKAWEQPIQNPII